MSTVVANSIISLDGGGAIQTHISQDSEFVSEGGASVVANNTISFGTLKGYCTNFFQSNNSIQPDEGFATFNVSGVTDVGTGNIRYAHVNNYVIRISSRFLYDIRLRNLRSIHYHSTCIGYQFLNW